MKTRTYILTLLAASIINALLPPAANLVGTVILCLALIPMAIRIDKEFEK